MPSPERVSKEQSYHIESEKPQHNCGVFGIWDPEANVARVAFFGLYALQHRGQESAGIATSDGKAVYLHRDMGLVSQVFTDEDINKLAGFIAIGHTRYSNTGGSKLVNAQPAVYGPVAVSENGNLVNSRDLRKEHEALGIFPSIYSDGSKCSSDGEMLAQSIAIASGKTWLEKIKNASLKWEGAYTLTIIAEDTLFGVSDHQGTWPFCLGRINNFGYVLASESCALDQVGARLERFVRPGEIIAVNHQGIIFDKLPNPRNVQVAHCPFDDTYFSRPDSLHLEPTPQKPEGVTHYDLRLRMGEQLAREFPVEADVVFGIPDSGIVFARGWSKEANIPFVDGFIKNRYIGRTFITPDQKIRDLGAHVKLNPIRENIHGRRVVVTDDSIVRATSMPKYVSLIRQAGATQVHVRIAFPRIIAPCHYGIDTYSREELISARLSKDELKEHVGADSLEFLSDQGFEKCLVTGSDNLTLANFCRGCYHNIYPTIVPEVRDKLVLEKI